MASKIPKPAFVPFVPFNPRAHGDDDTTGDDEDDDEDDEDEETRCC